jgi:hypothetical protein
MGAFTFFILQETAARKQPERTVMVNIGQDITTNIYIILNIQYNKRKFLSETFNNRDCNHDGNFSFAFSPTNDNFAPAFIELRCF